MLGPRNILLYGLFLLLANNARADVMVQLNINRPINDVSDKFISFTLKPEDLYRALDSSYRKTITRMASMLSQSYVKFVGDYYFAAKTEGIQLRNPTKIVWKGFNKWTKAVNWSMIIPVPYKPETWDPMYTLEILNLSQTVDIDEAIWQLGTDFGTSRAADYVNELKTFNVMVDSFKETVPNWQVMGADISAGSSPEETRRYVEMSRDLNVAYGWVQSADMFSSNSIGSSLDGLDPALKVLFKSNVPVWLSLPRKKILSLRLDDDFNDGLRWAQTMGEAANVGFETIFKPLTLDDMEKPNYGFYVTALFKKIMGSRVYPARPLGLFGSTNKLYTHCANMVSGGLAFMVVNKQDQPLQISVRSMNKLQDTEVWQFALTMQNGQVMLNNNVLFINSTLMPEVRKKNTKSLLQLKTPGLSVSFWVLPDANLEHCHFTEVETPVMATDFDSEKIKRYSSGDRLLKQLIKESSKPSYTPLAGLIRRQRRSVDKEDRSKRFVLEASKDEAKSLANFAESLVEEMKSPLKRDIFSPDRRIAAIEWLGNILKEPLNLEMPLLKRNARKSDSQMGPFFMTRDGKKTVFTKKITEIKKPEKPIKKFLLKDQEFDEEKFFQNVGQQPEPEYVRVPEGDVFLSNIASVDGDEVEEELKIQTKNSNKVRVQKKEIVSEMKPLRLLPTEFFEAFPPKPVQPLPSTLYHGSALNSLLLFDPFGKTYIKAGENSFENNLNSKQKIGEPDTRKDMEIESELNDEDDAVKAHIDMSQKVVNNRAAAENDEDSTEKEVENSLNVNEKKTFELNKPLYPDILDTDNFDFFGDSTKTQTENEDKAMQTDDTTTEGNFDEIPWWDLSSKRLKRSLDSRYPTDSWHKMISKDDNLITAANELSPARLHHFEHKVEEVVRGTNNGRKNEEDDDLPIPKQIFKTFKDHVTKFVNIFTHHANELYNTLTKQFDSADEETTTKTNRIT